MGLILEARSSSLHFSTLLFYTPGVAYGELLVTLSLSP